MPTSNYGNTTSNRPGFSARALFSLWLGFMIATTGMFALYPRLGQVSAPLLCHGVLQVDTQHYRPSPGTSVTNRSFHCADGTPVGIGKLLPTTWAIYAALIWLLVEGIAFLGRRIPAVSGVGVQVGLFLVLLCAAIAVALAHVAPAAAQTRAERDTALASAPT